MDLKVLDVFNTLRVNNNSIPLLSNIRITETSAEKTDLETHLVYKGQPFGKMSGIFEGKRTVLLKTDHKDEDFPRIPSAGKEPQVVMGVSVAELIRLLETAAIFTSRDNTRETMKCMLWEWSGKVEQHPTITVLDGRSVYRKSIKGVVVTTKEAGSTITASDGKRVYREGIRGIVTTKEAGSAILRILPNTVSVIRKMASASPGIHVARIAIHKKVAAIEIGNFVLRVMVWDGDYPDIKSVLSKEMLCEEFSVVGLAEAVAHLDQFKTRETVGAKIYADKITLGQGQYDKVRVQKTAEEAGIKGAGFNPCLITLGMDTKEIKGGCLAYFNVDFLKDIAKVCGNNIVMYFNKNDGWGFFTKHGSRWL
jgi:hypothetical protein